jgi:hypothetical protein
MRELILYRKLKRNLFFFVGFCHNYVENPPPPSGGRISANSIRKTGEKRENSGKEENKKVKGKLIPERGGGQKSRE